MYIGRYRFVSFLTVIMMSVMATTSLLASSLDIDLSDASANNYLRRECYGESGDQEVATIGSSLTSAAALQDQVVTKKANSNFVQLSATNTSVKGVQINSYNKVRQIRSELSRAVKDSGEIRDYSRDFLRRAETIANDQSIIFREHFDLCSKMLVTDGLNAIEHVRFFFPRQLTDGSFSTFEGIDIDKISEKIQNIGTTKNFLGAKTSFTSIKNRLNKYKLEPNPDGDGYSIASRLRVTLACGMAQLAAQAYIGWTLKSNDDFKFGKSSFEALNTQIGIAKDAFDLIGEACNNNINKAELVPAPSSFKVCNSWRHDLRYYGRGCKLYEPQERVQEAQERVQEAQAEIDQLEGTCNKYIGRDWDSDDDDQVGKDACDRISALERVQDKETDRTNRKIQINTKTSENSSIQKEHSSFGLANLFSMFTSLISNLLDAIISIFTAELERVEQDLYSRLTFVERIQVNSIDLLDTVFEGVSSAYASAEKFIFKLAPKKGFHCLSFTPEGKCASLKIKVHKWHFGKNVTELDREIDLLMAEIGDSLQSEGGVVGPKTAVLLKELDKYKDYIKEQRDDSRIRVSQKFFGDDDTYRKIQKLNLAKFKLDAMRNLAASGVLDVSVKEQQKLKQDSKKLLSLVTSKTMQPTNKRVKRYMFGKRFAGKGPRDNANNLYDYADAMVHKDKRLSIFKIISSRYMKKFRTLSR